VEPVTRWEVWDGEAKVWWHNHIEAGHVSGDTPTPKFPSQSGWRKRTWRATFGHLDDAHVLHLDAGGADPG
jgi:hypothetical protein